MADIVRVIVYDSVITAWSLPGGMTWRYARQKAQRTGTLGRAFAPKRSGQMAAGVESHYEGSTRDSVSMVVSAPAPALWVHEGTQGPIRPTAGTYLRLKPGGGYGVVYAKEVRGQRANPFLAEALDVVIASV